MKTSRLVAAVVIAVLAVGAVPARAEHLTRQPDAARPAEGRHPLDMDLNVKLGAGGFRLGGRLSGPHGVWGGRLDGKVRPDGFTLDGRVQDGERTRDFRLNADIGEWRLRGGPGSSF
ncbi:MAG: hypothetical protein ACREM3_20815 [Candidatus Rokuibacteriota bacterium]